MTISVTRQLLVGEFKMRFRTVLLAATLVGWSAGAFAAPFITGGFSITGNVRQTPATVTVDQAQGLNFVGASGADNGAAPGTVLSYLGSSGTFATLSCAVVDSCGNHQRHRELRVVHLRDPGIHTDQRAVVRSQRATDH